MKVLSPKKYIETKVRSLPVYKCFVNKDWGESKMADVVVMRKHGNGNITAGMFMVDLLCLGVKDTDFIFNESEDDITAKLNPISEFSEEIDYNTAHNIIYAGHDFALEFDIKPHKNFLITKYILEPDDDRIPLIEIPTGEDDGKPHLLIAQAGQYADALLKLKKNAGEGNYYYTIGLDKTEAVDKPKEVFSTKTNDFENEDLTPFDVKYLKDEDIKDLEKMKNRSAFEQFSIATESLIRLYKQVQPEDFYSEDVTDRAEYKYLTAAYKTTDIDSAENKAFISVSGELATYFDKQNSYEDYKEFIENLFNKYQESAFAISYLYEYLIFYKDEELITTAVSYLEKFAPIEALAVISLTLGALVKNISETRFNFLFHESDISKAFPAKEKWDVVELAIFWLMQVSIHLEKDDLKKAFHYYQLFAETKVQSWFLPYVQTALCKKTSQLLEKILKQRQFDLEKMREAEEERKNS